MPANRSRTMHWRRCLDQVYQRGGSLDIAVAHANDAEDAGDHLVWRVRLVALGEQEIAIERPTALGQTIPLDPGIAIVAILTVGQNRWRFATEHLGFVQHMVRGRPIEALRLRMPTSVRRCQRRMNRLDTTVLQLPNIDLWPLLDPKSVVVAERAQEMQFERDLKGTGEGDAPRPLGETEVMPEVGPRFSGLLMNIGGGGVGLHVPPEHNQMLARYKLFWMRLDLRPHLNTPVCASAKLVHTHMQSDQQIYAGMAFDFSFNAAHQRLVVSQICRYVAEQQREQRSRRAA